jgi:hypothetical protein
MTTVNTQVPPYVASRADERGVPLPEVGVGGLQAEGGRKRGAVEEEGLKVGEAVVRHLVEGLKGQLVRELVAMMDVSWVRGVGGGKWYVRAMQPAVLGRVVSAKGMELRDCIPMTRFCVPALPRKATRARGVTTRGGA